MGAGALRFPEKGVGVDRMRQRLQALGLDPDQPAPGPAEARKARLLAALEELHRAGVLDDEEAVVKRAAIERET